MAEALQPLLRVSGLSRAFGGVQAVDDVGFELAAGEMLALIGPNGAGKSTTFNMVGGQLRPDAGQVLLGGVDITGLPPRTIWRHGVGRTFQIAETFASLTVLENVQMALLSADRSIYRFWRPAGQHRRADALALLEQVGMAAQAERPCSALAYGDIKRVELALALAHAPRLLLMDEPLAALDAPRKAEILPYLERLHRELALPIVYVTHAMDEVARLADHLVLLEAGRVRAAGPLAELLARPDLPLARQDEAGVVISARVDQHDHAYGLSRVAFDGGTLWVGETAAAPGEAVRARVLARDVSVARQRPQDTSVLNVLPVVLDSLQADRSTALLRLRLGSADAGPVWLLARITRRSAETLALQPGDALFAQVKGVALM